MAKRKTIRTRHPSPLLKYWLSAEVLARTLGGDKVDKAANMFAHIFRQYENETEYWGNWMAGVRLWRVSQRDSRSVQLEVISNWFLNLDVPMLSAECAVIRFTRFRNRMRVVVIGYRPADVLAEQVEPHFRWIGTVQEDKLTNAVNLALDQVNTMLFGKFARYMPSIEMEQALLNARAHLLESGISPTAGELARLLPTSQKGETPDTKTVGRWISNLKERGVWDGPKREVVTKVGSVISRNKTGRINSSRNIT